MAAKNTPTRPRYKRECIDCYQEAAPRSRRCGLCRQARDDEFADRRLHGICYRTQYPAATQEMGEANYDRMMQRQVRSKNLGFDRQSTQRTETMPDDLTNKVSARVTLAEVIAFLGDENTELLIMAGLGMSSTKIAKRLRISRNRVEDHISIVRQALCEGFPDFGAV